MELAPIEWVVRRPPPRALKAAFAAAIAASPLLAVALQAPATRLAEAVTPHLGGLAPRGVGLTVTLSAVAVIAAALFGSAAWLRRRWGGCARRGELLVFFVPVAVGEGVAVRRDDVTGWDVGPRGVLVHAREHTRLGRKGPRKPERRGALTELVWPLLVPTADPAEVERVVAFLEHR